MGFLEGLLHVIILVLGSLIGAGIGTLIWAGYTKLTDKIRSKYPRPMFVVDIIFISTVCILAATSALYFIQ